MRQLFLTIPQTRLPLSTAPSRITIPSTLLSLSRTYNSSPTSSTASPSRPLTQKPTALLPLLSTPRPPLRRIPDPTAPQKRSQRRCYASSVPDIGRHFDTHLFVERLEAEGLSRNQSEVLVDSVSDVISDSVQHMMKNLATKAEQEKTVYTYKVDFAALKGEIQMLEKNEYAMLKSENERLVGEVEKLKQKLREEITRTQAGVRLDISLFRGALRDEASAHELKIKETDARVQSDISDLRTEMERVKYSVLSSLIGTITGAGALILAYMRMFQH